MPEPTDLLAHTFTAHERLAPDATDLLDDLDGALAARRRTRGALAGGAALVAAAVVAAVTLAPREHTNSPAADSPAADSPAVPRPSSTDGTTYYIGPFVSIDPHGLPRGARRTLYAAQPGEQAIGYDMQALGSSDLYLAFTLDDHGRLATDDKRGAQHAITVGGRPAHEAGVPGSYQLTVQRKGGSLLTVVVQDDDNDDTATPVAAMSAFARRLVPQIDFRVGTSVLPMLGLTALPSRMGVTAAGIEEQVNDGVTDRQASSYTLSKNGRDAVHIRSALRESYGGTVPSPPGSRQMRFGSVVGQPGRRVQGHTTTVVRGPGAVELVVHDFRTDRDVDLVGGTALVSLDDLYTIADGLRWGQ